MKRRILNWLIAFDQFAFNTITLGHSSPDETLSAAAWRWERSGKRVGRILRPAIDTLLWFDTDHCKKAFEAERKGYQLPRQYRSG